MNIAIDLTSYQKEFRGGKEQVVLNLIKGFKQSNQEIKLTIFCYEYYIEKIIKIFPDATFILFKRKKFRKILQDLYIRTFVLKKYMNQIDVLFFPIYYTGFHKFKNTTVVLPHDIQFKSDKKAFDSLTRLKETIMYYIDFKLCDHIIAISKFDESELKKYYPRFTNKIKLIYNPIDSYQNEGKQKKENILAINIQFVHKNIETLIRAYHLLEKHTNHKLILVGNIGDNASLVELVLSLGLNEKVIFTNYIEEGKLMYLLNNCAMYVTPSKFEGFGMTAVEAMMKKVPVISSMQAALQEVTFNKAFYYEPYDSEKNLAKVMLHVLENYPDDDYLSMMQKMAVSNYHYKKIANDYLRFFKEISSTVFFVDPMSYHNLALYDKSLISHLSDDIDVNFYGNSQYALANQDEINKIYLYSNYQTSICKAVSYIKSQCKLLKEVKRKKCKIIHLQWSRMPRFDYYLFKHMIRKYHIKFLYTSHDTFTHNLEYHRKKAFIELMQLADEIIVHTDMSKKVLKEHQLTDVNVINHGLLDIKKAYPATEIEYDKKGRLIISLLGFMEEYKGTDLLIRAWQSSTILTENEKIQLVVVGKNNMAFTPVIAKKDNIYYKDELIDDGKFTKLMEISDLIILPYQKISQSGLLLTALSMNKLVIVNDIGELANPVKKFKMGYVIKEHSIKGLRIALEKIVEDVLENGLPEIQAGTLDKINQYYSWEIAGTKTSEIYRKLLSVD